MSFWVGKRVLVTGGAGFIGSHVVKVLLNRGVPEENITIPRRQTCDLRLMGNCRAAVEGQNIVIHLAAVVGGIGFNQENPATLFYDNLLMGVQLLEAARQAGVEKFVSVGTACSYPKYTPVPFREEDVWNGYPEETNAPYGQAKRMLIVQSEAYHRQYGMNAVVVIPFNAYGPGDNFDPRSSHVIPALIRKCFEEEELVVWGDGSPSRSFVYVEDIAEGVALAAEKLNDPRPVNIGTEEETTIRELVELVVEYSGFKGRVIYDTSRPNGQPRRAASIARAKELLGYQPHYSLREGLRRTINWYTAQHLVRR
ncbi:MAG: GDP-L-fucose synthase [Chloroflexi bacterium]|nr:GDP-L-fucose synthase [Chloroflexota bacterium]MCL5074258.1 GDP-L-fucose synthase [Chloroflexota bacterium]